MYKLSGQPIRQLFANKEMQSNYLIENDFNLKIELSEIDLQWVQVYFYINLICEYFLKGIGRRLGFSIVWIYA